MFRFKRRLTSSESSENEAKELRTTLDDKKIVSCFEDLSNELFYEIFDYFDGCELYKAFLNLNNRFQALLTCSSLRLKIELRFHPEPILHYYSTSIIAPNKHRIISLTLVNYHHYNSYLTRFCIDSTFNQLESLVLGNIKSNELIPVITNLISLPRLFSLTVYYYDDLKQISNIYQTIFNLPMLNYYKLSCSSPQSFIPLSIASKEKFSGIKYLVIDHCCSVDELIAILSYTPQLHRLTCEEVNESKKNIIEDGLNMIISLTCISIARCNAEFDELETFLTKVSPQLEVLRINSFNDVTYLDANLWEQIISQHLLQLNVFDFKYEEPIDEELEGTICHERLNEFNSLFWIKRKWFFRISIDTNSQNDNVIVYSIFPYRKSRSLFQIDKENDESFIIEIGYNITQDSIISNQQESIDSSMIFSETNELTVIDLCNTEYNECFFDMIRPILTVVQITCLNITLSNIFIGTLIGLIKCLPNLDSLVISSLTMIQPRCLSVEEARTFRLLSNNNKITKVNLKQMNDLEQVQFLVDLCCHMKYFEVDCTNGVDPEKVLRFILMKNTKYMPNLCLLCLQTSETSMDIVDKLSNIIDFEQLCQNYRIKQIDNRIYLRLNL
ncbi:unnamed protein product [Rotaria sp. Silwood2]|nr:unnamed protein product [Rotaria sp. Silwood2]CAF3024734.1 unnamed protein product [Rotaria sp. Silwood2]CAF4128736.1 unnamed protein product [Rotaria sp. Silwood2]CAF4358230.1 unnamed protein product [Rotaria sp. Silwood2]